MNYRKLGMTDIEVSTTCLGCWALIGGFNWGPQDEQDSLDAIAAALEGGVNFFDTAPMYGEGASEQLLGKALVGRRDKVILATKVGSQSLSPGKLKESCEQSLRNLRTDYVDLLLVHWPSREVPFQETYRALTHLREAGKVRVIGVSNHGVQDLAGALACARVECNQMAYSLLWRAIEHGIQSLCVENHVSILCYSPLAQGLLTGKFASADEVPKDRARTRLFSSDRPMTRHGEPGCEELLFDTLRELKAICDDIGRPMSQIALAWLLAQPAVTSVVCGARNVEQVRENLAADEVELPPEVIERLSKCTEAIKQHVGANADAWQGSKDSRIR